MSATSRIPSYTEVYTTSPTAAGLPVLEVVKRLEEEKLISKEDRMALKEGLYSSDVARREEIVKALCEVELSMNSRFSIRRLKAVIHQNGGGEVSSKHQNKSSGTTLQSRDLEGGPQKKTHGSNLAQPLKLDSRPSKYRIKQKNGQSPSSPEAGGSPTLHPVTGTYIPSTHNNNNSNANSGSNVNNNPSNGGINNGSGSRPVRLFASPISAAAPTTVNSALEASTNPLPGAPRTADPPVIQYVNNNVAMSSPKTTSRSRDSGGSPQRAFSSHAPSSGGHTVPSSTPLVTAPPQSSDSNTPTSGRSTGQTHRHSPHRAHTLDGNGHHHNNNNNDDEFLENISTINAINQVVGSQPVYSGPDSCNGVLDKIIMRLNEFCAKYDETTRKRRKLAVLVGDGSFNPLTRMHLRSYFLAKQCLEAKYGYVVLGSLLSPAHGATVRERYRTNPSEIIPSPHRLAVAQLLVQNSKLLSIDPWEITRRRAMDYLSLLEHVQQIIREQLEDVEIKILYLCKPNMVPKLSPQALRENNFGVVSVCRTHESDLLRNALTAKWNGVITVVEDTAILDASMDVITSRKVRDKMKLGHSVEQLVGEKINDYVQVHRLGQKMNGTEKWDKSEKVLPSLASRPAGPTLTSQHNKLMQSQLQQGSTMSGMTSAGDYSPDRPLLPINELTTMNMSAHNNSHMYTHNINSGVNAYGQIQSHPHQHQRMITGSSGFNSSNSGTGLNNTSLGKGSSGVYTPTWATPELET